MFFIVDPSGSFLGLEEKNFSRLQPCISLVSLQKPTKSLPSAQNTAIVVLVLGDFRLALLET